MHYFWSYCHFLAAILDAILFVIIIAKDIRSPLNISCASVFGCLGLWSLALVGIHHPATPLSKAELFERIGSFGWIWFTFFFLWFTWLYTRKPKVRFFKVFAAIFIAVPTILVFKEIVHSALITRHVLQEWGWLSLWGTSFWVYLYFAYYATTVGTGLYLIVTYWKTCDNPIIRKQSIILIFTAFISTFLGTVINIILPLILPQPPTPIADITTLVWGSGLAYTALKYRMLDITPFIAAQKIIAVMNDLLFLLDIRGNIMSVNGSAVKALACDQKQLIGCNFRELIAENEPELDKIFETVRTSASYTVETILSYMSGSILPVALSTSLIPGTGIVCVAHDISLQKLRNETLHLAKKVLETEVSRATQELQKTNSLLTREISERKQAALALMQTEERFRVIFEDTPDGIYLADPQGILLDVNRETIRITGVDKPDLVGKRLREVVLSEENESTVSSSTEITIRRKDGTTLPVEITTHPIKIGSNDLFLGVIRDLSQRKKSEAEAEQLKQELQQAQKMEAIGRLAGGIAHDFNNLLGGIIGYAGLAHRQLEKSQPAAAEIIGKILSVARDASERVAQLLAFARKGKYKIEPVDMHKLIDEVIELLTHTIDKKITLTRTFEARRRMVLGDHSQLHSALLNIAVNARDALPHGGAIVFSTVTIDISPEQTQEFHSSIESGDYIQITICDNGIGMDEETRSRIFEPFFSTKDQGGGTGLGLASVYGTINHHNGFIELKSSPDEGTTFIIGLPLTNETALSPPVQPVVVTPVQRKGTILIVDDVRIVREMMTDVLKENGLTVFDFADGYEAIAWYRDHFKECSLVVLDYTMPIISGRECFEAMKKINPLVKTIISSGHALDNEIGEILKEGALSFIQKPFEIEKFAGLVNEVLGATFSAD